MLWGWYWRLRAPRYSGSKVEFPCCGDTFGQFAPDAMDNRPNRACPRCDSLPGGHRLPVLFLQERTEFSTEHLRGLEIAPQRTLFRWFKAMPNLDYVTAAVDSPRADVKADLTNMPFEDGSFDAVIAVHVLEQIPNDRKVTQEVFRVLRPGGWAILHVPIDVSRATTRKPAGVENPRERRREFGQANHVRIYGRDSGERLREAGFAVSVEDLARSQEIERFGLIPSELNFSTNTTA